MKPLQGKTCEGFSIARMYVPRGYGIPIGALKHRRGEVYAQKTIKALQVSRLPEPDGQSILPGAPEES